MCIIHRMTLRARHDRTIRLGQCLARLENIPKSDQGCLQLKVMQHPGDAGVWHVEGHWRSVAARNAFLAGDVLSSVLAEAIGADLIAHLQCTAEALQQVA